MSGVSWREAKPMVIAVSCLSPVNTHTLIPACLNAAMLWGTPYSKSIIHKEQLLLHLQQQKLSKYAQADGKGWNYTSFDVYVCV